MWPTLLELGLMAGSRRKETPHWGDWEHFFLKKIPGGGMSNTSNWSSVKQSGRPRWGLSCHAAWQGWHPWRCRWPWGSEKRSPPCRAQPAPGNHNGNAPTPGTARHRLQPPLPMGNGGCTHSGKYCREVAESRSLGRTDGWWCQWQIILCRRWNHARGFLEDIWQKIWRRQLLNTNKLTGEQEIEPREGFC